MKANRKFVNGDEAVSPVIAVILMVAITVVLAATVYLFVSGFGSNQSNIVTASFAAKSVDMPLGAGKDADTSDDVIELTYTSGQGDLALGDVKIFINGVELSFLSTSNIFVEGGTFAATDMCTTRPGGDDDASWERGASLYLFDTSNDAGVAVGDCTGGPSAAADWNSFAGIHLVKVVVQNQVVLDTTIEVHDNGGA
jgi:flagellin-like protein